MNTEEKRKKCNGCVHLTKWYSYFYCKHYNDYTRNIKNCNHRKERKENNK